MLNWVEYEKSFITSDPGLTLMSLISKDTHIFYLTPSVEDFKE